MFFVFTNFSASFRHVLVFIRILAAPRLVKIAFVQDVNRAVGPREQMAVSLCENQEQLLDGLLRCNPRFHCI